MVRNIGINVKVPTKECTDRNCPFHGKLRVRGRMFEGKVIGSKPAKTAIVEWRYFRYLKKFERYEGRKTRVYAHNPSCINAKEGDRVRIMECRPLSKIKKFVIIEKIG
ncbi:MAG: 30S ribosomal protein S17 [Candidatus Parvarchaeota archaeon]|nr:30S ribosomal protein S17 [Candidatus Jingweiarchaeum tengchongense]MCW1297795.1 30S ribosomal protein S17 [Candidatus Jingweiarchaeum tengchongense]MCW1299805.1 30S ribosomal protein S17 [Candidatus Jingweiarchaeum tengchongense]MCW1304224.1 30S ribosomal protein S17 [Candidatus Jingweiarchaeum tengchongense]MCW1305252.1 30S ribosomal protein S17 [Candidatus Jingweiarchaeum tengchongense]